MGVILANSIEIGLNKFANKKNSDFFYFNGFYVFEMALKISAYGFFINKTSYLRDKWNLLDFFAFFFTLIFDKIIENGINFMPLRLLRFVDYLEIKKIQYLLNSLFSSFHFLIETFLIFASFIFVSAIISLHLFAGIYQEKCFEEETGLETIFYCGGTTCPSRLFCSFTIPHSSLTNYDDIFHSFLLSLRIVTLDDWTELMNSTQQAYSNFTWFLFFLMVSLGNFFFLNLIIGALKINFSITNEKLNSVKIQNKQNSLIIKKSFGKYNISLKRYNLKLMKMYHLHKHIDLSSKILSHLNAWTVDTKASSILNSIKSFFSRIVRASFFVRGDKKDISDRVRSNSELPIRKKKNNSLEKLKPKTFFQEENKQNNKTSISIKKKSGWMEPYVLKSAFISSKRKKEEIKKISKELENKYFQIIVKYDLEFKSSSFKDILPSK